MLAEFRLNSHCNRNRLPAAGLPLSIRGLSELKPDKPAAESRFPLDPVVKIDDGQILFGAIPQAVK